MDDILLKRDQEFLEINAELDLKADILMKEVENIMKCQVSINETGESMDEIIGNLPDENTKNLFSTPTDVLPTEHVFGHNKKLSVENGQPAATWRGANPEPELRFLRAKLKILTTELERQQSEHHQKMSEWRTREGELRALRDEKEKSTQQGAAMGQQLSKLTATVTERSERIQRAEADNAKLTNELHAAKKDAKTATQRANTLELRLNRLLEEGESLRAALHNSRLQEKEEREEQRRKLERQAACVQRAERQRNELALAFRRQMLLCQNLQQQKELLVAGAALQAAEIQFDKLLATKPNK